MATRISRKEASQLKKENDRLYSHHSACKQEIGRLNEIASRWRIRCFIVEELLRYLNKINPFWTEEDLEKEINILFEDKFKKWQRREKWWE